MTEVIDSLARIAPRYGAIFCDLWGCLHNGQRAYPAAVAALQAYRQGGGRVVLLTNAPRPNADVVAQLERLAVPQDAWDLIVSSGDAAQYGMFTGVVGQKVWHLGPDEDDRFFTAPPADLADPLTITRVALAEAEGIVCTGPLGAVNEVPEDYRPQLLAARVRGLTMLCTNPDLIVDSGDKRIYCAGALAALYEEIGGRAFYFGKPHPPIYDLARRRLTALTGTALSAAAILAIGDGIGTDVAGGIAEGLDTLFVTGGLAADQFGTDVEVPDPDLLGSWLAERQLSASYAIGRLR